MSLFSIHSKCYEGSGCDLLSRVSCLTERWQIGTLIAKVRDGIESLKEYRIALISAAVTGKIDVREEVAG